MTVFRKDIEFDGDLITFIANDFVFNGEKNKGAMFQAEVDDSEDVSQQIDEFIIVVNEMFEKKEKLKKDILSAVFEYYRNKIYPKADEYNKVFNIKLKKVNDINDIEKLISINQVFVFIGDNREQGIGFGFSSEWDTEHGLGVRMVDWRVCGVGGADRAFLAI